MELVEAITSDLGDPRRRGQNLFWRCPFHEDHDPSLTVTPDSRHWKCFGCNQSGDVIDWLTKYRGLSYSEAINLVRRQAPEIHKSSPPKPSTENEQSPPLADPKWQTKALQITEACVQELHGSDGELPQRWLQNRGLTTETLVQWQIGYNPQPRTLFGLRVDRGITIPWSTSGKIEAFNVRRAETDPKYKMVTGSRRRGLYLGETVRPGWPTLLVEGEFDALLGWQEVHGLVNVTTLGSASSQPDALAIRSLLGSPTILIAFDSDNAGDQAARRWHRLTRRAYRVRCPTGKDLTEFFQSGGNIKNWAGEQLQSIGFSPDQFRIPGNVLPERGQTC